MVGGVHRYSRGHRSACTAHISQDSDSGRPTNVVSKSRKHSIWTHFPKDRNCEVCLRTKMTMAPCRRRTGEALPRAEKFGDLITADQKVLNEERTSALHRSETNGIAERAVRRVKEGTSTVLLRSGLDEKWWPNCYLRDAQDLLTDGKTPYERRFGEPLKGPRIPFGAVVECHPISTRDLSRFHQFGKKVLPGTFLGYELITGDFGKEVF